jgi:hypothetical protein
VSESDPLEFVISIATQGPRRVCITALPGPLGTPKLVFAFHLEGGFVVEGEQMALTLTSVQKAGLSVSAVDAKGNPAAVESVVYETSDPAIVTVTADATDQTLATILAVGPLGNVQITVTADADIGEGVTALTGLLDVIVVAAEAVALSIAPGVPENQ